MISPFRRMMVSASIIIRKIAITTWAMRMNIKRDECTGPCCGGGKGRKKKPGAQQPGLFNVYQDNLYGGLMFFGVN